MEGRPPILNLLTKSNRLLFALFCRKSTGEQGENEKCQKRLKQEGQKDVSKNGACPKLAGCYNPLALEQKYGKETRFILYFPRESMITKLCLLTCVLSLGQGGSRNAWLLVPRLGQGQELVYSGTFEEESLTPGVHYKSRYRLGTKVFVLESSQDGWKVAFLTSLQRPPEGLAHPSSHKKKPLASVRLEIAEVSRQGHVQGEKRSNLYIPVTGPPTLEHGNILLVPKAPVHLGESWEVREPGQPLCVWKATKTAIVSNTPCVVLEGLQKSPDWDEPRADSTAWKRTEKVWLAPQNGMVYRLERIIERREPARKFPTHRSTLRYEKDSHLVYPTQFFQDCRAEIGQAHILSREAEHYLQKPSRYSGQIDVVLKKIAHFTLHNPQTPYRKALTHLEQRLQAAKRGETIAFSPPPTTHMVKKTHTQEKLPDFLVTELTSNRVVHFKKYLGQPLLVVFYNPTTTTGNRSVRFAQKMQEHYKSKIQVLGMAVTNNPQAAKNQQHQLNLSFPVLDGRGFHKTFAVDATPRFVVVDSLGRIYNGHTGWGLHTPGALQRDLQHCLSKMTH